MRVFKIRHKRKAAIITAVILLLFIFGIFNFGMKYTDPPIEYGVAINFGNSEVGSGGSVENVQEVAKNEEQVVQNEQKESQEQPLEDLQEDIVIDNSVKEAPKVVTEKSNKKSKKTPVKEKPKKTIPSKVEAIKKPKTKPKPSKATTDALNNLLNGTSSQGSSKGEGDDSIEGVKGSKKGDPKSSKYYGNGSNGSGGNYNLSGRSALSKPKTKPNCEQEGTVVVRIFVNKKGRVTKAIPGVRGTTNSAKCLFKAAKEAALKTKWNEDSVAPNQQKGTIIYKFSLAG